MLSVLTIPRQERRSLFQNTRGEKWIPSDASAHLSSNLVLPLPLCLELLKKRFASFLDYNTYILGEGAFHPKAKLSS
jgi:hypothetical protein